MVSSEWTIPTRTRLRGRVEPERVDGEEVGAHRHRAAPHGAKPRQQFLQRERLDQVIIGPAVEPCDAVVEGVARRENQHRSGIALGAQFLHQGESRPIGEAQVEHDRIVGVKPEFAARLGQAPRHIHGMGVAAQTTGRGIGQPALIFDQKDSHPELIAPCGIHRGFISVA